MDLTSKTRKGTGLAAAAGLALGLTTALAPMPARATSCNVDPFAAYDIALRRSWGFSCLLVNFPPPGAVLSVRLHVDPPRRRVGCRLTTGPFPSPLLPLIQMRLFEQHNRTTLRNGWQITGFEISGGQWGLSNLGFRTPMVAYFRPNQPGRTWTYYVSRLTLTKAGGQCSRALDEAF